MTDERRETLCENYRIICENIERAKAMRPPEAKGDVTILAATKHVAAEDIAFAVRVLGIRAVGENRAEELAANSADPLRPYEGADVHFIGTLQTRKARAVVPLVSMVESVDSLKLAAELDKRAAEAGRILDVLVEYNSGREPNKSGIDPSDAPDFFAALDRFPHLRVRGGMTMAPKCVKKDEYHKYFRETYRSIIDIWRKKSHNIIEPVISMGMSDSYEQAVAEGATIVRIGTALFGAR
jgi:pyridoxal phosphate enzyme (YggS family)